MVTIFGTIGVVSSFIPLSSSAIVFYRASLGSIFLFVASIVTKNYLNIKAIKKNFSILLLAGIFMGLNWVFQFEAFKVSSVSVGTVAYNTMPIFVLLLSPIMFKERLTLKSIICIIIATIGIIFVSNIVITGFKSTEILGCLYGLAGALFYALVVLITKKMSDLTSYDKVIFEFVVAAIIMLPYMLLIQKTTIIFDSGISEMDFMIGLIMLLILCFVHTGISYIIYFDSVSKLKAQEVAIFTYIDPVVALILSSIVLKERLNMLQILGAVLILLSTLISELSFVKKKE